ncbi:MAG: hypothetical protein M1815_001918 [Lichina confinis]|nr:MAG: hypothetical protein M1815_001918 [Lichina confinis]
MRSYAWILLATSAIVGAQPAFDPRSCPGQTLKYFESLGKRFARIRGSRRMPTCNPPDIKLPVAPTPLPEPEGNLLVSHVSLGRGTQNYTCADSAETTKPVAIGALASLHNVTCMAATAPDSIALLPGSALEQDSAEQRPLGLLAAGEHFFVGSTPRFNVGNEKDFFGSIECKKEASSPAPAGAPSGQRGQGHGAVAWLKLSDNGVNDGFQEVYRIHTAGGSPPPTCAGMPPSFEVQYAALYYFLN